MSQLWVGPLGGLIPFPEIEHGHDLGTATDQIGADHVSLTGASTTDVLGMKRTWSAAWSYLTDAEVAVLRAAEGGNLGPSGLWLVEADSEPNLLPASVGTVFGFPRAAAPEPGLLDAGEVVPASTSGLSALVPLLTQSGAPLAVTLSARIGPGATLTLQAVRADGTVAASASASNAGGATLDVRVESTHLSVGTSVAWRAQVTTGTTAATVSHAMLALGTDLRPWGPPGQSGRVRVDSLSIPRGPFGNYSGSVNLKQR